MKTLWTAEGQSLQSPDETRSLIEVAQSLYAQTTGRLHKQCGSLIFEAHATLDRLSYLAEQRGPQPHDRAVAFVPGCRVLGGHGLARPGESIALSFTQESLWLRHVANGAETEIPYTEMTAIEIGGPGATRSGGGFIGGGFGLEGAAEGMLVAAALNSLTTRTSINTVICLQTASAELFLHNGDITPNDLRIRLSPVFTALRQRHGDQHPAAATDSPADTVDRLAKLGDLLARGLITEEEFLKLKADMLG